MVRWNSRTSLEKAPEQIFVFNFWCKNVSYGLITVESIPCELLKKASLNIPITHVSLIPLHITQSHPCRLYPPPCPSVSIVMCAFHHHHQVRSTLILIRFANRRPRSSIHPTVVLANVRGAAVTDGPRQVVDSINFFEFASILGAKDSTQSTPEFWECHWHSGGEI